LNIGAEGEFQIQLIPSRREIRQLQSMTSWNVLASGVLLTLLLSALSKLWRDRARTTAVLRRQSEELALLTATLERRVDEQTQRICEELAERKQAEQALIASETQLRLITDALPVLISYIDRDLVYRFCNAAYKKWFDKSKGEILGRSMREVLGKPAVESLRSYLEKVLAGETVSFEVMTPYASGERPIAATYIPDFGSDGVVKGFCALVEDISERRQAEAALRQSEKDFRNLAEAMPQIVWTSGSDGLMTYSNQRWRDQIDAPLPSSELWYARVHSGDIANVRSQWKRCAQSGRSLELECRLLDRPSGEFRWFLARAVPMCP
jgi:PAS domain S-box-containing protein